MPASPCIPCSPAFDRFRATSSQAWMNKTGKAHCAPPIHHTKSSDQSDAVLLPNNPEGPQPVAYPSASDALDRSSICWIKRLRVLPQTQRAYLDCCQSYALRRCYPNAMQNARNSASIHAEAPLPCIPSSQHLPCQPDTCLLQGRHDRHKQEPHSSRPLRDRPVHLPYSLQLCSVDSSK